MRGSPKNEEENIGKVREEEDIMKEKEARYRKKDK